MFKTITHNKTDSAKLHNNKSAFFGPVIQPKLTINQPNDVYEQEADAMANKIMRTPDTSINHTTFFKPVITPVQRKCVHCEEEEKKLQKKAAAIDDAVQLKENKDHEHSVNKESAPIAQLSTHASLSIQTKCAHCDEEEKKLQKKEAVPEATMQLNPDATPEYEAGKVIGQLNKNNANRHVHVQTKSSGHEEEEEQLQSKENGEQSVKAGGKTEHYISSLAGGAPLSKGERSFFESRMNHNFSGVRIHNDSNANASARNINALAYTHGNHIVFGSNQYQPNTDIGKRLMAHELTHVIQQGASTGRVPSVTEDDEDTGVAISNISRSAGTPLLQKQGAPSRCCCCVDSVAIGNISRIDNAQRMGHSFQTTMNLSYGAAANDRPMPLLDSCRLEWWERTNVPYVAGMAANTWTDMTQNPSTSGSFTSWNAKTEPCPGSEAVVDTDPPSLGKTPGRTVTRTLEFRVRVVSSDQCGCRNNFVETIATQVLSMVNAAPVWASSSFTTP